MSDLFDGIFDILGDLAGETDGKAAELAAEGAGALLEGTVAAAGAIAEGAGPALAGAARGAGHLAGAVAEGIVTAAGEGLVEGAIDAVAMSSSVRPTTEPKPTAAEANAAGPLAPPDNGTSTRLGAIRSGASGGADPGVTGRAGLRQTDRGA